MTKIQPFRLFVFYYQNILTMSKSTHFSGQPMYGQLIDLLDKRKVLDFSRTIGSERYVKSFDAWQYLLVMLYAVIKSLDSLREISASMYPEAKKLAHIGLTSLPRRSTLSDANARRSEKVFERVGTCISALATIIRITLM